MPGMRELHDRKSLPVAVLLLAVTSVFVAAASAESAPPVVGSKIGVPDERQVSRTAHLPPFSAALQGLTGSPWTVGKGKFQLETSFSVTHDRSRSEFNFPTLLRYGVLPAVELRLMSSLVAIERDRNTTVGTNGLTVGAIATILELEYGVFNPTVALLGQVELPTGALSTSEPNPRVMLLAASDLTADLTLTVNVGADFPESDAAGDRFEVFRYALMLSYDLTWWSEDLGMYVENSGNIRTGTGEKDSYLFDVGVSYQVAPNMQINVFTPFGLNSAADDIQGNITFSWRI